MGKPVGMDLFVIQVKNNTQISIVKLSGIRTLKQVGRSDKKQRASTITNRVCMLPHLTTVNKKTQDEDIKICITALFNPGPFSNIK
jgi:hypothetical protein